MLKFSAGNSKGPNIDHDGVTILSQISTISLENLRTNNNNIMLHSGYRCLINVVIFYFVKKLWHFEIKLQFSSNFQYNCSEYTLPPLQAWKRNSFGFPASAGATDAVYLSIMSSTWTFSLSVPSGDRNVNIKQINGVSLCHQINLEIYFVISI